MPRASLQLLLCVCASVPAVPALAQCPDGAPPPCAGNRPVPPDSNLLAVVPFAVTGPPAALYLGHGIMDQLRYALADFAGWRVVGSREVLARMPRGSGEPSVRVLARAMRRIGATRMISGHAVTLGSQLRIHAELHDTRDGLVLRSADARASIDAPEAAVDSIAAALGQRRLGERLGPRYSLTEQVSGSTQALRLFWVGEDLLHRGEYEQAMDTLRHAIRIDSTFGLAYYTMYLASTHGDRSVEGWNGRRIAAEGLRFGTRMTPRLRARLTVALEQQEGRGPRAVELAEEFAQRYPEDSDIAGLLGDGYFHFGLANGVSAERALAALDRAILLDPGFTDASHIVELRLQLRDTTALRSASGDPALNSAARMLYGAAPPAREANAIGSATDAGTLDWPQVMLLLIGDRMPQRAIAVADSFAAALAARPDLANDLRAFEEGTRAGYLAALGRDREAGERLRAADALGAGPRRRIMLDVVRPGLGGADAASLAALTSEVEAGGHGENPFPAYDALLLAWHAAEHGDTARFARLDHLLDSTLVARHAAAYLGLWLEGVRGLAALTRGDTARARALLSASWSGQSYFGQQWYTSAMVARIGLVLARLDAAAGALEPALQRLHRTLWHGYLYRAEAEELRGAIYERLGNAPAALAAYRTFITLWDGADPSLQPRVAAARAAVARLVRQ